MIYPFGIFKGAYLLDGEQLISPEKGVMIDSDLELELIDGDFLDDGVLGA